jgi:catechol 1,2-dioxygenase
MTPESIVQISTTSDRLSAQVLVTESTGRVSPIVLVAGSSGLPASSPTEDDVLGPYYRSGAPFRAKVSPPCVPGTILVIRGQVWSYDTKRPLHRTVIDIWQANAAGHYDNEDPSKPPPTESFSYRTRVLSNRRGRYEFETILPGAYRMDETTWRSPHVHFRIRALRHLSLVTQLFFEGEPYLDSDPFVKKSLIIPTVEIQSPSGSYRAGIFDIVLARKPRKNSGSGK